MANKGKYDDSYNKFGFTVINDHKVKKGQCAVYYRELSNESLSRSKWSNHLEKNHQELKDNLSKAGNFQQTDQKLRQASFVVSQIVATVSRKKLITLVKLQSNRLH